MAKTFVEKVLNASAGAIVFHAPDIVLTHDNTASIRKTFEKIKLTLNIIEFGVGREKIDNKIDSEMKNIKDYYSNLQ